MNTQSKSFHPAPRLSTASDESRRDADTRIHGSWLVLARAAWILAVALSLAVSIADIPLEFRQLHMVCVGSSCGQQLTAGILQDLHHLNLSVDFFASYFVVLEFSSLFVWVAVALLIFWRRSNECMALLVALFLVLFPAAQGVGSPAAVGAAYPSLQVLTTILDALGWLSLLLFFYLFPNGRFIPSFTRVVILAYVLLNIVGSLVPNPPFADTFSFLLGLPLLAMVVGIGLFSQVYRYRRISSPLQRQQTKWVVYGAMASVLLFIGLVSFGRVFISTPHLVPVLLANTAIYGSGLLIPLSIGFSILRYRLWDIDIIINRTLVYGLLTAGIVAIYVLVVVSLGTVLQAQGNLLISLVATGLIAVLFQPLRLRLQRAVNRLMYGERDTPYTVISRLGQRLEATLAPEAVLPTIVETVAQALKLPYAAITWQQDGAVVSAATFGKEPGGGKPRPYISGNVDASLADALIHLPLIYQTEQIGELVLAPRGPGESFTPADHTLLSDLARQAGVAAHAVRLTTDLQRLAGELQQSRTQLVTTREEERRRLRRDLHDGLGSALTSVTFQLDAANNLLDRDPATVKTLLKDLKAQTQASIADIRRLVYNLRPPILDEWGLVAALREQVAQYQLNAVQVTVEAPEPLPALLAAVEVAAYRIALEALANVIRHAQATRCTIRLAVCDDALAVEVQDNGKGLPPDYHAGVGISGMRERAAELGGSCVIEDVATGGTRVYAQLPLLKE